MSNGFDLGKKAVPKAVKVERKSVDRPKLKKSGAGYEN